MWIVLRIKCHYNPTIQKYVGWNYCKPYEKVASVSLYELLIHRNQLKSSIRIKWQNFLIFYIILWLKTFTYTERFQIDL